MQKSKATDASILIASLASAGRSPESLLQEELLPLYAKIRTVKADSDTKSSQNILPISTPKVRLQGPVGVIVETREHRNLPFVVDQVCKYLGITVQIYHGNGNREFILRSKLSSRIADGEVILSEIGKANLDARLYNGLFLTPGFWDSMIGRNKVLVFQSDTVICPRSSYRLDDFLDFDYIGPTWKRGHTNGILSHGGIGGFTLRDWQKSKLCLQRFSAEKWPAGEDRYFAFHMELVGGLVAQQWENDKFCTQHYFRERSFGAHKLNGLSNWDLVKFWKYCPESWRIVPWIEQLRSLQ